MSIILCQRRGANPAREICNLTGFVCSSDVRTCVRKALFGTGTPSSDDLNGVFIMFENQEISVMTIEQLDLVEKMLTVAIQNKALRRHEVS